MRNQYHVILLALFCVLLKAANARVISVCDPATKWTDAETVQVDFSDKASIKLFRYSDALVVEKTDQDKVMRFLQHKSGKLLVKPYDLDPMKNFLEIDQVAGIPLQVLNLKYQKPCNVPEGSSSLSGAYPDGTASFEGQVTRNGPDLKFFISLLGSGKRPSQIQVTGVVRFAKDLPRIEKSFPLSGWGVVGTALQLPEGTTLGQIITAD